MLVTLATVALAAAPPDIASPLRTGHDGGADAAVVIGIDDYAFLPDVPHAGGDAQAFYNAMLYTRGIPQERIQLLKGANREQIRRAVERARGEVGDEGTLWVYFSGHGGTSADGEPLLVGDDAKPDPAVFAERSVVLGDLGLPARAVLVVDAPLDGTAWDGTDLLPGARFAVPAYADVAGPVVWTAAGEGRPTWYEATGHGLFTWLVIGALRGWADGELDETPDGVVSLAEARAYVDRAAGSLDAPAHPVLQNEVARTLTAGALEAGPDLSLLVDVHGREPPPVIAVVETRAVLPQQEAEIPVRPVSHLRGMRYTDARGLVYTLVDLSNTSPDGAAFDEVRLQRSRTPTGLLVGGGLALGFGTVILATTGAMLASDLDVQSGATGALLGFGGVLAVPGALSVAGGLFSQKAQRRHMAEYYNEAAP